MKRLIDQVSGGEWGEPVKDDSVLLPAAISRQEVHVEKALPLVVLLSLSVAGCAGSGAPSRGAWQTSSWRFWEQGDQGIPATTAPDFSKPYTTDKISPQRGGEIEHTTELPKPDQPGRLARMTSAITGSSAVKAVKSVFTKDDAPVRGIEPPTVKESDENEPVGADFYVKLAHLQERAGNLAGAADQYELALKADSHSLDALLGYARLRDRQGNFAEATALYRRTLKEHPKEASAWNDLALCLSRQKQTGEALAALQKAVELEPERKLYRNNLAKLLIDAEQNDLALEQLLAAHPPATAHYNLGYLLQQKGDPAAALQFARALELDPSMSDARTWLQTLQGASAAPPSHDSNGNHGGDSGGLQWNEPQTPAADNAYQGGAQALPMVLRPRESASPQQRYGLGPAGYYPPQRY